MQYIWFTGMLTGFSEFKYNFNIIAYILKNNRICNRQNITHRQEVLRKSEDSGQPVPVFDLLL